MENITTQDTNTNINKQDNSIEKKLLTVFGVITIIVLCSAFSFMGGRLTNIGQGGSLFGTSLVGSSNPDSSVNTKLFWTVWNTLKNNYVDPSKSNNEKMISGAIKGMVNSYDDPATLYFTAEETQKFNEQNSGKFFEGIGAELGYRDNAIIVVSPIKGSPAEKVGLMPGDIILKVDGKEVKGTDSIYDVVDMIRGTSGTKVVLNIYRKSEGTARDVEIVRGSITLPAITLKKPSEIDSKYSSYDNDTVVLNVSRFTEASLSDWDSAWDQAVKEIKSKGYKNVIIDLRNNPGGYFDAAIYAASDFLPKGTIVSKQQDKNGNVEIFKVERVGRLLDEKVIVLVNEGSASASEILSGALQQNNRAQIYGVNTYGKGTAQNVIDFDDGSSLHVTIMKWLLPNGDWLNTDNPIKPDVEVKKTDEDFKNGIDPQFKAVMDSLK